MQTSTPTIPAHRPWRENLYLIVASLILVGIVGEGLLIGPSLFATTHWGRAAHGDVAVALFVLTLLLAPLGLLARLPGWTILVSGLLFVLTLLQFSTGFLGSRSAFFAALHPAAALLMAGLTGIVLLQVWHQRNKQGDDPS